MLRFSLTHAALSCLTAAYILPSYTTMPETSWLSEYQIAAIAELSKAGLSNKAISQQTGVALRSVQWWSKKVCDAGAADLPLQKKSSGRPLKITKRTLNLIKRQVEANPRLTAREIKQINPALL